MNPNQDTNNNQEWEFEMEPSREMLYQPIKIGKKSLKMLRKSMRKSMREQLERINLIVDQIEKSPL